ncbi:MAG: S41 family peptidase [Muribaculaceae bacterium]|nr:S41 family peptidase [Muribaculaceae bacterium]
MFLKKLSAILLLSVLTGISSLAATRSSKSELNRSLDIFNAMVRELQLNYVDTIDIKKSVNTAMLYMLDEIDPYTEYYPADEREQFNMLSTGEYAGIGCLLGVTDSTIFFSEPYLGTPSQLAGVKAGDVILTIDGDTLTRDWDTQRASSALRGAAGTKVSVTVRRPFAAADGSDSIIAIDMERAKIKNSTVSWYGVTGPDKRTGYISLSSFTDKAPAEVTEALEDLINNHGITALVLDLQGNPGGLLESAVQIAGLFVPKGTEIVRTRGRGTLSEKVYKTTRKPLAPDMPLAVLIDEGSASSSEIVAGALQDLDRAVIVGYRSYGKGLVQSSRTLPYDGVLKLTVAKYYIPSGRLIQAIDYSHRNADGSVARTPDSLTTAYNTLHGRVVRDGGGITPDVKIDRRRISHLIYNLHQANIPFDFATAYASTHPSIAPAGEFHMTDSIFSDFKKFVASRDFHHESASDKMLKSLREAAETEGYLTDEVSARFAELDSLLNHDTARDLEINRKDVDMMLSDAIIRRYYYQGGATENSLRFNDALIEAVEVLSDPDRYRSTLNLPAKR